MGMYQIFVVIAYISAIALLAGFIYISTAGNDFPSKALRGAASLIMSAWFLNDALDLLQWMGGL